MQNIQPHNANLPAACAADHLLAAAREDAGGERLVKFKKGKYVVGDDEFPAGQELVAHASAWTKCWIKFENGQVAERRTYNVSSGETPADRNTLGDLDETKWKGGLDGKPADPWILQYLLPLENLETGEVVIFATSSVGGRRAVADLCSAYAKRARKQPKAGQPIVQLAVVDMPTRNFGKVPRPSFNIVGWDDGLPSAVADDPVLPPTTPKFDAALNDEIPF